MPGHVGLALPSHEAAHGRSFSACISALTKLAPKNAAPTKSSADRAGMGVNRGAIVPPSCVGSGLVLHRRPRAPNRTPARLPVISNPSQATAKLAHHARNRFCGVRVAKFIEKARGGRQLIRYATQ